MSLINEALKRAKDAQKRDAPPPASVVSAALRPVEPVRPSNYSPINLLLLAFVALVMVCGCIIWFALRSSGPLSSPQTVRARSAPRPTATASRTESKPAISQPVAVPSQLVAQPSPPVGLANVSPAPSAPAPVSAQAQSAPTEPPTATTSATPIAATLQKGAVVKGPPPIPKLQGIFYRPQRPAALIDGKMVLIGRVVGDYRVVDISQESVTVVRAGQTNVLKMPD